MMWMRKQRTFSVEFHFSSNRSYVAVQLVFCTYFGIKASRKCLVPTGWYHRWWYKQPGLRVESNVPRMSHFDSRWHPAGGSLTLSNALRVFFHGITLRQMYLNIWLKVIHEPASAEECYLAGNSLNCSGHFGTCRRD